MRTHDFNFTFEDDEGPFGGTEWATEILLTEEDGDRVFGYLDGKGIIYGARDHREDSPYCHGAGHGTSVNRVTNWPDRSTFDLNRTIVSVWVCERRSCVLDAMAWVERQLEHTDEDDRYALVFGPLSELGGWKPETSNRS